MNPFLLEACDLPQWYKAAFENSIVPTVVARTHPQIEQAVFESLSAEAPGIAFYRDRFGFRTFAHPSSERWGFPGRIGPLSAAPSREQDGWMAWRFPLPRIFSGGPEPAWKDAYALAATLSLFWEGLDAALGAQATISSETCQLFRLSAKIASPSRAGAHMSATVSPGARWLLRQSFSEAMAAEGVAAMRAACEHLWNRPVADPAGEFAVNLDPPDVLRLTMPMGNAVGLAVGWPMRDTGGYVLKSHNVDTPLHQFTLLAGLCRLHEFLDR